MKLSEVLNSSDSWCKEYAARNIEGRSVAVYDPAAISFCLMGAARKVSLYTNENGVVLANEYRFDLIISEILKIVAAMTGTPVDSARGGLISMFNDAPTTRFEHIQEIVKATDAAIANLDQTVCIQKST